MPITITCSCGKALRVSDEHAGRRVRCPGCGAVQTVPEADEAPAPRAPAPAAMIQFACDCGKQMRVRAEYAGRAARCPECGATVAIPAADESEPRPAPKAAKRPRPADEDEDNSEALQTEPRRHKAPSAARSRRAAVEEEPEAEQQDEQDTDDPDARPRRRKRIRRRGVPVWVWLVGGSLAALLLAGTGLGVWWFLGSGTPSDLAFVPADAAGFTSVRLADLWNTDLAKKLREQAPQANIQVEQMQKEAGLAPTDIERVTVVLASVPDLGGPNAQPINGGDSFWAIMLTSKPYDRKKMLEKEPNARPAKHEGKEYYVVHQGPSPLAYHFAADRILVLGTEGGVKQCLTKAAGKRGKGPLDEALRLAAGKSHIVVGFNPQLPVVQQARQKLPRGMEQYQALFDAQAGVLTANLAADLELEVSLFFATDAKAKEGKAAADTGLSTIKGLLGFARMTADKQAAAALDQAEAALKSVKIEQKGTAVSVQSKTPINADALANLGKGFGPMGGVGGGAVAAQNSNNLKQLGLAMISYADAHNGQLPPAVIKSRDGKPLYSWRVELLPYLEQQQLYQEFHKDEPWDSPHNRTLLPRMPSTFALPGIPAAPGDTYYQVFTGPKTPFAEKPAVRYPTSFTDGTSNTMLIVEAATPVPWTKPADIPFDARGSVRALLGYHVNNAALVAMADGAVVSLPRTVGDTTLRAAVTPAGGDALGPDWPGRK
jgi:hypothetical protein